MLITYFAYAYCTLNLHLIKHDKIKKSKCEINQNQETITTLMMI